MSGTLTPNEHLAMAQLAAVAATLGRVIDGDSASSSGDRREAVHHVHALQAMVMSQAAARAHPELYRLLGGATP